MSENRLKDREMPVGWEISNRKYLLADLYSPVKAQLDCPVAEGRIKPKHKIQTDETDSIELIFE